MEPSLSQIEDYQGKESKEKKLIVYGVIAFLISLGIGYSMVKVSMDSHVQQNFIPYQYKVVK